jgi:hypothetical protein
MNYFPGAVGCLCGPRTGNQEPARCIRRLGEPSRAKPWSTLTLVRHRGPEFVPEFDRQAGTTLAYPTLPHTTCSRQTRWVQVLAGLPTSNRTPRPVRHAGLKIRLVCQKLDSSATRSQIQYSESCEDVIIHEWMCHAQAVAASRSKRTGVFYGFCISSASIARERHT